ncbi:hypothetical protein [Mycolicibacterium sp. CBMA 226]|uniref:hypothetical protein n=1 Tax=Mycolicibacterium sp. CBMA 226 TaxID=2606611 RepID=UPI0012DDCA61|nr:hypothetical protein [Mycolicibacterium sp. CBMA 226]MUL78774.1 hypothetical protein [Mycolicibacterium sp. CBMA 226]QGW61066.1 hypothetical protein ICEMyc226_00034 [Mycolicibacterium sp.]
MRILLAFFCMFAVMTVVIAAMAIELLITLLPYLILGAVVLAIVRLVCRRSASAAPAVTAPAPMPRPAPARSVAPRSVNQGGWVMVPMWFEPAGQPVHEIIDAEVIDGDIRRG